MIFLVNVWNKELIVKAYVRNVNSLEEDIRVSWVASDKVMKTLLSISKFFSNRRRCYGFVL